MSVEAALALTGFVLALAATGIFYTLALRVVRALRMSGGYERLAAALATVSTSVGADPVTSLKS
jgi:hypothetical protein